MKFEQNYICPRCNLPQEGIYRCQYCGYLLSKDKKYTRTIWNRLKNFIGVLNKNQIFTTKKTKFTDKGGTRSGTDRRKYKYMNYFPEKRSGKDRRKRVGLRGQVARKRP